MVRMVANTALTWRHESLYFGKRRMVSVVQDEKYPQMWRVRLPNGQLTDMVNLSRAKDAARSLALGILNKRSTI